MRAELWPVLRLAPPERRGPFFLATLARLAPGARIETARAELEALGARMFPLWQQGFQDATARLAPSPLGDVVVAGTGRFLWLAFAAVAVVLLIALANAANLVLMRIAQRRGDLGVRAALGAGRWRLARLVLGENLWLVAGGAFAGVVVAAVLLAQYRALGPAVPRIAEVALDANVLAFALAVASGAALLLSLVPLAAGVLDTGRTASGARGASSGREPARLRDSLVVLEIALAVPLLIAAALLVESLVRLQRVDPGFDAERLLTQQVRLPENYPDEVARNAFWSRALPVLRAVPGIEDAALASALPPSCGCYNNFDLVDRPATDGNQPQSPWVPVDAGYFALLGARLLEGRVFDARDTPESPPVLVVSRSWAERYFPGQSPVGRELHEGGDTSRTLAIVGVVEDVKYDGVEGRGDVVFAPLSQGWGDSTLALIVRTRGEPLAMAEPIRAALRGLEPTLVPRDVAPMTTLLADAIGGQRHWAAVIAAFAIASLLLAAIGVFAVLAYHVAQRQREIGIRQALGADARGIVGLVVWRGLRSSALGVAIGLVLAAFATRALAGLLHDVAPTDPLTWLAACALVLATGAIACWLPARRAARVDPLVALRHD
jgi:predicted permease